MAKKIGNLEATATAIKKLQKKIDRSYYRKFGIHLDDNQKELIRFAFREGQGFEVNRQIVEEFEAGKSK